MPTDKIDQGTLKRIINYVYFKIRTECEHGEEINTGKKE